ncbi:rod shape-determining protein RodA [Cytophagales bacterium LB-30]|uniref:Cell wall polymerase n=1 Tax=Shiella aurantiaca TaxID=3058365 RepID=A0ABT8F2Z5_9BACT|nr:rod shape-determining protein RodA [Shiella aurantiaca]MDN4164604.1 rod shape-determining protein RodA [Shiella aurantiaca]
MRRQDNIVNDVDWITILLYGILVILGWLNIYAAVYDEQSVKSIFDLSQNSGKQLLFIGGSILIIITVLVIDFKFYDTFAYVIYGVVIGLLVFVLLFGHEVAGSKSWFQIGGFRLQPSEIAKFASALALSKYLSTVNVRLDRFFHQAVALGILLLPVGLIILQGDTGTSMVFAAMVLAMYREGFPGIYLVLGLVIAVLFVLTLLVPQTYLIIGLVVLAALIILFNKKSVRNITLVIGSLVIVLAFVRSVDFVITDVFKPHQQNRIKALINPNSDPLGYGWNVTQSKIAIGSGGFLGKGFLEGTQTKFDFVPEQSTDFIFCTIGEEHGWIGSLLLIGLFVTLMLRITMIAERQKSKFARVYAYCIASIFFFHFLVNIGMTIGLFPVVGIPLPFFSYGGSSLWSFTIMLFILIKLDAHRKQVLVRL